jgi:hypothetical protein
MSFEREPHRAPVTHLGMKFERGAQNLALACDATAFEDVAKRGIQHAHCLRPRRRNLHARRLRHRLPHERVEAVRLVRR